jgi:hypothetical protein
VDVLSQLPDLAPLGLGGSLVLVILYLLRANHVDRAQAREAREAMDKQHADEVAELNKRLASRDERLDELDDEVDHERKKRRTAEDAAALHWRRAYAAEAHIAAMTGQRGPTLAVEDTAPQRPRHQLDGADDGP